MKYYLVYIDDEESSSSEAGSVHYSWLVKAPSEREAIQLISETSGSPLAAQEMELIETP